MKIKLTTIHVNDQDQALRFYTEVLGLTKKADYTNHGYRWLTVVSPEEPEGTELQLAAAADPAAKAFQTARRQRDEPALMLFTDELEADHARIAAAGGKVVKPPTDVHYATMAQVDDGSGNLIQLTQLKKW